MISRDPKTVRFAELQNNILDEKSMIEGAEEEEKLEGREERNKESLINSKVAAIVKIAATKISPRISVIYQVS